MHLRDLRLGTRVVVQKNKAGTVKFLGRTKFAKDDWVGVELDHAAGKHDGAVEGVRYFQCSRNNTGVFVRANDCELEPPPTPERRPSTAAATHSRGGSQPASPAHARATSNASSSQQASTVAASASSEHDEAADDEHAEAEAADTVSGSPAHPPRRGGGGGGGAAGGSAHFRSSSDLARVELEALLAQPGSGFLKNKKGIVRELTTKIARRPTQVQMIKSGIINDAAGKRRPKSPGRMKSASASGSQTPSTPNANAGWAQNAQADPSKPQRRMYVFGENAHGELSTGDEVDCFKPTEIKLPMPRPTRTPAGSPATPSSGLAASSSASASSAADSTAAAPAPGTASSMGTSDFAQVCLGLHHMVVLTWNNEVLTCGSWVANLLGTDDRANLHRLKRLKQFEQLRATFPENPIISIGCGDRHTVALHQDGACESFGGTLYGKLGHRSSGASYDDSPSARDDGSAGYLNIAGLQGQKVSQMDAGNWHTACCTLEGSVYTFGGGGKFYNQGQLGHGDKEDSMMPRRVERFGFQPSNKVFVVSICCGGYHTLALTIDRQVYSWGSASFGQLGLGSDNNETTPQLVTGLLQQGSGVGRTIGLAAGENHSLCVQSDGSVYSWGYSLQGQCGHGLSANEKVPRKIHFFASRNINIVQVDAGWRHSIALADTHSVYTFGHGDRGQLGLGDTRSHSLPQLVESLEGCDIKTVAAGGSHSLAFTDFFKAAQELVFLQKVRAFKDVKATRQLPDMTGGAPAPGSKAARDAARAKRLGYSASPSPKRSGSPSRSASDHPTRADFGLASPNPLVPSDLKHLLREAAAEAGEEGAKDENNEAEEALKRFSIEDDDDDDSNERKYSDPRGGRRASEDEDSDTEYPEDAQRPGESLKDFHARRAANRERRRAEKRRRALAGATSSTLAFADRSRAPVLGANGEPLSIELVYSSQVHCIHRFLTFQSRAPEEAVNALLDAYEAGAHCSGPGVVLKQTLITPGNTVARSQLASEADKASQEVLDHSYTYDQEEEGPARYTLMVILRAEAASAAAGAAAASEEEDLWPAWADDFYRALLEACPDVKPGMQSRATEEERAKADLAQACFRELRPPIAAAR